MTSSTTNADAPLTAAKHAWLPTALTIFRICAAPAVAALILWAASFVHRDHYLAGFVYVVALLLFVTAAITDWLRQRDFVP